MNIAQRWGAATLTAVLSTAALSCSDSFGPDSGVVGNWYGTGTASGNRVILSMHITRLDSVGGMSGTGTVSITVGIPVTVGGTFQNGNMNATLNASGFVSATFIGKAKDKDTIAGELNASGFNHIPLTVRRNAGP